jgi:hypothetical protein
MKRWSVTRTDEFAKWFRSLTETEQDRVEAAISALEAEGPTLTRPLVDTITKAPVHNLKELRPSPDLRVLFAFDPTRTAVLLVGWNKSRGRTASYAPNVRLAGQLFNKHVAGLASPPATKSQKGGKRRR